MLPSPAGRQTLPGIQQPPAARLHNLADQHHQRSGREGFAAFLALVAGALTQEEFVDLAKPIKLQVGGDLADAFAQLGKQLRGVKVVASGSTPASLLLCYSIWPMALLSRTPMWAPSGR